MPNFILLHGIYTRTLDKFLRCEHSTASDHTPHRVGVLYAAQEDLVGVEQPRWEMVHFRGSHKPWSTKPRVGSDSQRENHSIYVGHIGARNTHSTQQKTIHLHPCSTHRGLPPPMSHPQGATSTHVPPTGGYLHPCPTPQGATSTHRGLLPPTGGYLHPRSTHTPPIGGYLHPCSTHRGLPPPTLHPHSTHRGLPPPMLRPQGATSTHRGLPPPTLHPLTVCLSTSDQS